MSDNKATGIAFIHMNGKRLVTKEGAKIAFGGMERTAIVAQDGSVRYAEKPIAATVEGTIIHDGQTDVDELNRFVGGSITFVCDSGQSYLVSNAFTTKPSELTAGEGELTASFAGQAAVRI